MLGSVSMRRPWFGVLRGRLRTRVVLQEGTREVLRLSLPLDWPLERVLLVVERLNGVLGTEACVALFADAPPCGSGLSDWLHGAAADDPLDEVEGEEAAPGVDGPECRRDAWEAERECADLGEHLRVLWSVSCR